MISFLIWLKLSKLMDDKYLISLCFILMHEFLQWEWMLIKSVYFSLVYHLSPLKCCLLESICHRAANTCWPFTTPVEKQLPQTHSLQLFSEYHPLGYRCRHLATQGDKCASIAYHLRDRKRNTTTCDATPVYPMLGLAVFSFHLVYNDMRACRGAGFSTVVWLYFLWRVFIWQPSDRKVQTF